MTGPRQVKYRFSAIHDMAIKTANSPFSVFDLILLMPPVSAGEMVRNLLFRTGVSSDSLSLGLLIMSYLPSLSSGVAWGQLTFGESSQLSLLISGNSSQF